MSTYENANKEETNQNGLTEESVGKTIRREAHAVARRWFAGLFFISFVAALGSIFVLYLYATQFQSPTKSLSPISENSAEYLRDRLDDLAESQKWVLLIFGGLAALITLLGASFQWLQYAEGRREREVREPGQQTMLRQVNEVIDTVGKTLAFRLREEKELQEAKATFKKLEDTVRILRAEAKEILGQLEDQLPTLSSWPRITFTSLDSVQEAFATRFLHRFSMLPSWFRKEPRDPESQEDLTLGHVTYFAGVIAFVNNDIVYAMNLLEEAKSCRDRNASSQDEQLQLWGAFVTYWMGLVEKNWGKLEDAKKHFKDSLSRYGPQGKRKKQDEWLTRLSRAEILMYDSSTRATAKKTVEEILSGLGKITKEDRTETQKMWVRAKLLIANGERAEGSLEKARSNYEEVQTLSDNYYASFSRALCMQKLGMNMQEAKRCFTETLKLIHDSGDLRTKKELGPLVGLHYVAMRAAQWSGRDDIGEDYRRQLFELLEPGKTEFSRYQLRIFVPDKVRLIAADELRGSLSDV